MLGDMPLINDYSLCKQSVTVYHYNGTAVTRTVHFPAYFEAVEKQTQELTHETERTEHLIVIPGSGDVCEVGDKVFCGVGAELPTANGQPPTGATGATGATGSTGSTPAIDYAKWWREFIPAKVDGLVIARSVSYRHWRGEVVHCEIRG